MSPPLLPQDITMTSDLRSAAENVTIAYGMGWDMDGVIDVLRAALSRAPEVEAVGWTVGWAALADNGNIRFWKADKSAVQLFAFEHDCEVVRLVSPSPEMGEISRDELKAILDDEIFLRSLSPSEIEPGYTEGYGVFGLDNATEAILSKLKENGLSREGLGGSARSQPGAACPSDCAEGDAPSQNGGANPSDGSGA